MGMLTESDLRAFGDRLERWFNELSGGEQVVLRDILARAAAATRFLEAGMADYASFDPSDLVYRCGRGCLRDPPSTSPQSVIPRCTVPSLSSSECKEDTNDD